MDQNGKPREQKFRLLDHYAFGGVVYCSGTNEFPDGLLEYIKEVAPQHLEPLQPAPAPTPVPANRPAPVEAPGEIVPPVNQAPAENPATEPSAPAETVENPPSVPQGDEVATVPGQFDPVAEWGEDGPLPSDFPALSDLNAAGIANWHQLLGHEELSVVPGVGPAKLKKVAQAIDVRLKSVNQPK